MNAVQNVPHIVIVGGGFAGLKAARELEHDSVRITLIDQSNHHLFQPLLYQVATGMISPNSVATPLRALLGKQKNIEVVMARVDGVDPKSREVILANERRVSYDYLILATGANQGYFGHPEWERFAPGLKSISHAGRIRQRLLSAFEAAETEPDLEKKKALLTFVTVGGGPTGVELSGALAHIATRALAKDFRHIGPGDARFILMDAGPRILKTFSEKTALRAQHKLESLGVEVRPNTRVRSVDETCVVVEGERIPTRTVMWAAGVVASPAARWLGIEADRAGRAKVLPNLTVPGYPEIFVVGDTATLDHAGKPIPGVAPAALQQGHYAAKVISGRVSGKFSGQFPGKLAEKPFHYFDKGNLATVGPRFAAVELNQGKLRESGFFAWLLWLCVHVYYLSGFRNRLAVFLQWTWTLLTLQEANFLIFWDLPKVYRENFEDEADQFSDEYTNKPPPSGPTTEIEKSLRLG
jgi:NADH:ubiquinone reductase (H+-translocating)